MDMIVSCPNCREWVVVLAEQTSSPVQCPCGASFVARRIVHGPARPVSRWRLAVFGLLMVVACPCSFLLVRVLDIPDSGPRPALHQQPPEPDQEQPKDAIVKGRDEPPPVDPLTPQEPAYDPATDKVFLACQAREQALVLELRKLERTSRHDWGAFDRAIYDQGALVSFPGSSRFAFAASAPLFATASEHTVHVWDLATGASLTTIAFDEKPTFVGALAFSPDARLLAVAANRKVSVHLAADGSLVKELRVDDPVQDLAFTSDSNRLTAVTDNFLTPAFAAKSWVVASWNERELVRGNGSWRWTFSQDGDFLFCQDAFRGALVRYDLRSGERLSTGVRDAPSHIYAGPDRRFLVADRIRGLGDDNLLRIDVRTGIVNVVRAEKAWLHPVTCSADGRLVCYRTGSHVRQTHTGFRLIDVQTGEERWSGDGEFGTPCRFSPGGELLAVPFGLSRAALYPVKDLLSNRWHELAPSIEEARRQEHKVHLLANKLIVETTTLEPDEWRLLVKTLPQINVLRIWRGDGNFELAQLKDLPELEELYLQASNPDDAALAALQGLKRLRTLDLRGRAKIQGSGLRYLRDLPELRRLDLSYTGVDDAGLEAMRDLKQLTELDVSYARITATEATFAALQGLKRLRTLDLRGYTKLPVSGLRRLRELPELRRLDLEYTGLDDAGLQTIGDLKRLTELDVSFTRITAAGLIHLEGMSNLRILTLPKALPDDAVNRLKRALPLARFERRPVH